MLSAMTAARKSCAREKDARCAFRKEWRAEKIKIENVVRTVKAGGHRNDVDVQTKAKGDLK